MPHEIGVPCLHQDPQHEGRCSTPLPAGFVDLGRTRWFEVIERQGSGKSYWRSNATAMPGVQVEHLRATGWRTSFVFDTEVALLKSIRGFEWREITAEEVPDVAA